jgi:hypothetical protein
MRFADNEAAIMVLHSPREKVLGYISEITPAGVSIRCVDLSSFDEWCRSLARGESYPGMTDNFFPMWRVERITRDESAEGLPSMVETFKRMTGRELFEQ